MAAAAAALATLVLVAGCAEPSQSTSSEQATVAVSSTPPPGPQAATLGSTVDITAASGTASYTVANLAPVPPDAQIIPAKGTMYSVDVNIVGRSGTTVFNGFFFAARGRDGTNIAPAVGAVRPGITAGELSADQSATGHVAFDVPPGASIDEVVLRDPKGKSLAVWVTG
jgi:hypothetical protein